jgi:hypothetical protein
MRSLRSPGRHRFGLLIGCVLAGFSPARAVDPPPFVRASGGGFKLCDQDIRFVGFNLQRVCHYGYGDLLPFSNTSDIATNLNYCVAAKATVIRLFCAYNGIGQTATGNRLQTVLDACQARGIRAIVAFTDVYNNGQHPQGDTGFYTVPGHCCGLMLLNHTFYESGYTTNYLPQALYLANRFRDHPAVFAWQLGNEIRDVGNPATTVSFCQNVAAQIRAVDPNHMISAGMIGYRSSGLSLSQALQLYGSMDFVGTHNYNGDDTDNDSDVAGQLNKPYVIDEAGFAGSVYGPDRTPEAGADIQKWLGRGVDGYLQWGLMATDLDNGDGDQIFGVDKVFHNPDFTLYRNLFNAQGAAFQLPPTVGVSPGQLQPTAPMDGVPPDDVFLVQNLGPGSFNFQVSESTSWLSVSPAAGTAACASAPVTIQYATSSLLPGTHHGSVQIVSAGTAGSPRTVPITLTVLPPPADHDGDGDVDQSDFGPFQLCLKGPVPQLDPACGWARLNADNFVDVLDLDLFLGCMSGADIRAHPNCTQ